MTSTFTLFFKKKVVHLASTLSELVELGLATAVSQPRLTWRLALTRFCQRSKPLVTLTLPRCKMWLRKWLSATHRSSGR